MFEINKNALVKVNVQALYDFAIEKKAVHPMVLRESAQTLYDAVKDWGITNINCTYKIADQEVVKNGNEIAEVMRAVAIRVMQQHYRMTDSESGRMEQHFNLDILAKYYLNLQDADKTQCMSLVDFENQFLKANPKPVK